MSCSGRLQPRPRPATRLRRPGSSRPYWARRRAPRPSEPVPAYRVGVRGDGQDALDRVILNPHLGGLKGATDKGREVDPRDRAKWQRARRAVQGFVAVGEHARHEVLAAAQECVRDVLLDLQGGAKHRWQCGVQRDELLELVEDDDNLPLTLAAKLFGKIEQVLQRAVLAFLNSQRAELNRWRTSFPTVSFGEISSDLMPLNWKETTQHPVAKTENSRCRSLPPAVCSLVCPGRGRRPSRHVAESARRTPSTPGPAPPSCARALDRRGCPLRQSAKTSPGSARRIAPYGTASIQTTSRIARHPPRCRTPESRVWQSAGADTSACRAAAPGRRRL